MRLFVFGLGYTSRAFVRHSTSFDSIGATVRSPDRAAALSGDGLFVRGFDTNRGDAAIEGDLAVADALLTSVPPDANGDPVLRTFGDLIAGAKRLGWIGYLSTIGVYGDRDGKWVDETTKPSPKNDRARWRLVAERDWLRLGERTGKAVHVFRLAGIYGPGRNALANLRDGTARRIVKPGQIFNRIHVDDIAEVLTAAHRRGAKGAIWNVADDEPSPPEDVILYAARLLGVPAPAATTLEEAHLSALGRSFWEESKRVRNGRIRGELGVNLTYPTYREGLKALLAAGEGR